MNINFLLDCRQILQYYVDRGEAVMDTRLKPFMHGFRNDGLQAYNGIYKLEELVDFPPERHFHDYYEFYLHIHGGQYMSVENNICSLQPGSLILLPPFCMHGTIYDHDLVNYERLFFNVTPQALMAAGCGIVDPLSLVTDCVEHGHQYFTMSPENVQKCIRLTKNIMAYPPSEQISPAEELSKHLNFLSFMQIVLQTIQGRATVMQSAPEKQQQIQRVLSYIDQHFAEPLTLETVAKQFNISISSLCHMFSRYTGRSMYEYTLYRRINYACEMLMAGKPLTSVAYQCGFNNYSSFMRMFKKIIGMPPNAYLKQNRNL